MLRYQAMKNFNDDAYYDESEEDDLEEDSQPCPFCQRMIYEDAERCPHCEQYITEFETTRAKKPVWIIVTAIILIVLTLYWYVVPLL